MAPNIILQYVDRNHLTSSVFGMIASNIPLVPTTAETLRETVPKHIVMRDDQAPPLQLPPVDKKETEHLLNYILSEFKTDLISPKASTNTHNGIAPVIWHRFRLNHYETFKNLTTKLVHGELSEPLRRLLYDRTIILIPKDLAGTQFRPITIIDEYVKVVHTLALKFILTKCKPKADPTKPLPPHKLPDRILATLQLAVGVPNACEKGVISEKRHTGWKQGSHPGTLMAQFLVSIS